MKRRKKSHKKQLQKNIKEKFDFLKKKHQSANINHSFRKKNKRKHTLCIERTIKYTNDWHTLNTHSVARIRMKMPNANVNWLHLQRVYNISIFVCLIPDSPFRILKHPFTIHILAQYVNTFQYGIHNYLMMMKKREKTHIHTREINKTKKNNKTFKTTRINK